MDAHQVGENALQALPREDKITIPSAVYDFRSEWVSAFKKMATKLYVVISPVHVQLQTAVI
jgi:hypothetical protein